MGTYIELYKHPKAAELVPALNELMKSWGQIPHEQWLAQKRKLNIPDDAMLPADLEQPAVQYRDTPNPAPFLHKVGALDAYLRDHNAKTVYEILGFSSAEEPAEKYVTPDWEAVLRDVDQGLNALLAIPNPQRTEWFKRHANLRSHEEIVQDMERIKGIVKWISEQKDRNEYFFDIG